MTSEQDGIGAPRLAEFRQEFEKVERVLARAPTVPKDRAVSTAEFLRRQQAVAAALERAGLDCGFVFSDQQYAGDVPYLGGNTNISIEQVAGAIGRGGFHIIAGLEGGYIAEQLASRARAVVHKVELLQLADEKYPITAERLEDALAAAALRRPARIGLLTPRQVLPASLAHDLEKLVGAGNLVDVQELYYRIRYEKSDEEMGLIADANLIADSMLEAMIAVLRPGLLETQVAGWGYLVGKELGAEENGWDIMVGANQANRTLIGKALNRPILAGDFVHLGVAPKRDGLNSCCRRSVVAAGDGASPSPEQLFWLDFVADAYRVGFEAYVDVAASGKPARLQEAALVEYFRSRSDEVGRRIGKPVSLERLKPYTGTHNAGYTECQEFFGAITLDSAEPLGRQIVTMLDVAVRGFGDRSDQSIIPGLDFVVVENTLGKYGTRVETMNRLPVRVQDRVGRPPG
jgi:Xaa-Pro aminopeptidase